MACLEAKTKELSYGRLVLVPGAVTRILDIPGLAGRAVGFKTVGEALYLRDLLLRHLELANDESDPERRTRCCASVVVDAGLRRYRGGSPAEPGLRAAPTQLSEPHRGRPDWKLLDMAPVVMLEFGPDLGESALDLLRKRKIDVRLKTIVGGLTDEGAVSTDGTVVPGAVVVWCAGVAANPLVAATGLETVKSRLRVAADLRDPEFTLPATPRRYPNSPKQLGTTGITPTAADGAACYMQGPALARGYHVHALPTNRRRLRTLVDWALAGRTPDDVSFGFATSAIPLASAEHVT